MKYKIKNRQIGSVNLLVLLIIGVITATGLSYVYRSFKNSSYEQEAEMFSEEIILLAAKITNSMAHENDCTKLNNRYVIDNGLLTSVFKKHGVINSDSIQFKYGNVTISSNLPPSLMPTTNAITPNDGFYITLSDFKWNNIPLFIDPLIEHFDRVMWIGNIVDKNLNINTYNALLNYENNGLDSLNVKLDFVKWGC